MQNRETKSEQVKTFLVTSGAYRLLVTSLKKIIYCTGNRKTEPKCFQGSFCQWSLLFVLSFWTLCDFFFLFGNISPSLPRQKNHNVTLYKQIDSSTAGNILKELSLTQNMHMV